MLRAKVSELSNIVSIYPNPTKDILNIGNIEEENYVAKIFTFTGMQIIPMLVRVMLKCDKYVTRALLRIIYHIKTSLQVKIEVQLKISVSGRNIFCLLLFFKKDK